MYRSSNLLNLFSHLSGHFKGEFMKKCSTCGREYGQQNLQFCTNDGGALMEVNDTAANDLPPTVFSIGGQSNTPPLTPPLPEPGSFNPSPFTDSAGNDYGKSSPPPLSGGNPQPNFQPPPNSLGSGGNNAGSNFGGNQVWFGTSGSPTLSADNSKEGQVKARLLDLFGSCQKQNFSAASEFFYYRGQPVKQEETERSCRKIKASLDEGNGYEFGKFLTQGAGEKEVAAWEVYFKRGAERMGQIFAFQMIDGKYRLVDIDPIRADSAASSSTNSTRNTNSSSPQNSNRRTTDSSDRTFDSLRQTQLGSFKLSKTEKTGYMKMYPNLEEESLTYINSSGKKVFVNKSRFPSKAEAESVVRNMIQTAKNGGAVFTEIVPCYSNDGQEVGVTATRTADKDGAKNYTIYYSHENVVTFIFNLENDKSAVDEVFKNGEY
jgi:hypothetical protein